MKSKFLIVFTIFIITVSTAQGLTYKFKKPRSCTCSTNITSSPVVSDGNKTYFHIEDRPVRAKRKLCPIVTRKKSQCICKLPICECCRHDNPETWFVKTFVKGDAKVTPAQYSINHANITKEISDCLEELKELENEMKEREKQKNSFKTKFCQKEKKPVCGNKWLYGCPPLLNLNQKNNCFRKAPPKKNFNIQTDCLECKLQQSPENESTILLKCEHCSLVDTKSISERINFSKLILPRKNSVHLNVKFLQVTREIK